MLDSLRYWLIKKLAGRDIIVINAKIVGDIKTKFFGQRGHVENNLIIQKKRQMG